MIIFEMALSAKHRRKPLNKCLFLCVPVNEKTTESPTIGRRSERLFPNLTCVRQSYLLLMRLMGTNAAQLVDLLL